MYYQGQSDRGVWTKENQKAAEEMRVDGLTYKEIGALLGWDRKTVSGRLASPERKERIKAIWRKEAIPARRNNPERRTWGAMLQRCYDTRQKCYARYGGAGITVCDRWNPAQGGSFDNFLTDVGRKPTRKHSLDRIDPLGSYCPENVRWATAEQQARNKTNSALVIYEGKLIPMMDAAELSGINYSTLRQRRRNGWADAEMFMSIEEGQERKVKLVVEVEGVKMPLVAACKKLGVKYVTAKARISKGWPMDRVLAPISR